MANKNSPAKLKANNEYNKRAYKSFHLRLKPHQMEVFSNHCERFNHSKNQFLITAMIEKIERETNKNFDELLKELQPAEESDTSESTEASGTEKGEE